MLIIFVVRVYGVRVYNLGVRVYDLGLITLYKVLRVYVLRFSV